MPEMWIYEGGEAKKRCFESYGYAGHLSKMQEQNGEKRARPTGQATGLENYCRTSLVIHQKTVEIYR